MVVVVTVYDGVSAPLLLLLTRFQQFASVIKLH